MAINKFPSCQLRWGGGPGLDFIHECLRIAECLWLL